MQLLPAGSFAAIRGAISNGLLLDELAVTGSMERLCNSKHAGDAQKAYTDVFADAHLSPVRSELFTGMIITRKPMHFFPKSLGFITLCIAVFFNASCGWNPRESHSASALDDRGPNSSERAPILMISGQGDYWRPGQIHLGGKSPSVIIDSTQTHQTWRGLGGTFNEAGWHALSYLSEADRREVMKLLFDGKGGIGFEWGRIPIGASDFAMDRYSLSDTPGDEAMQDFSIERDKRLLIPFIHAAQEIKDDIIFWGSPWSPPPWMKTNQGFDGGAFDPRYYDAYARYFVKWVQAYEAQGIPIDHVQPQNEPGWTQAYPSCAWGPSTADGVTTDRPVTLGTFVENHLAPAMEAAGLDTAVWYGALSNNGTFQAYWEGLSANGRAKIKGVGLQWGTSERVQNLAETAGKDEQPLWVMQTEHKCGNYPWLNNLATSPLDADRNSFLPNMAPNNHAYAEESWELIREWIEAGVHIFSAWNMVLDKYGFNMDTTRPWPQNTLITVDTEARKYRITPAYYVFRHVGQYLDPGATRVTIRGADALAFQNPDDSVTAILFNPDTQAVSQTLSVDGSIVQFAIPARGWATVRW